MFGIVLEFCVSVLLVAVTVAFVIVIINATVHTINNRKEKK